MIGTLFAIEMTWKKSPNQPDFGIKFMRNISLSVLSSFKSKVKYYKTHSGNQADINSCRWTLSQHLFFQWVPLELKWEVLRHCQYPCLSSLAQCALEKWAFKLHPIIASLQGEWQMSSYWSKVQASVKCCVTVGYCMRMSVLTYYCS